VAFHVDLNVVLVGADGFPAAKRQQATRSVAIMKTILGARGPDIGTVKDFTIRTAAAGSLLIPRNDSDARALADRFAVQNDALDLFVVQTIPASARADGWSPVGGRCDKKKTKGLRSPVVSLNGSEANSGNTFAHEVGHFLGLQHCEKTPGLCTNAAINFIASSSNSNTDVTLAQSNTMKAHCQVRP
jgi:Metallo-peptidase family M12B Reprolysin-like